ncbi:MAG TPA: VOC family protein, partial [Methylomirabilota bacterium]
MPPTKLAHVVFQTNRKQAMQDWYCAVLGGRVVYENAQLGFMTYDDEHHRVAFIDFGPLAPRAAADELGVRATDQPGIHHVA